MVGQETNGDSVGARIRAVRKVVVKMKQDEFAELFGVSRQTISAWERNVGISTDNLLQIPDRTGVSLEWLSSGRGPMIGELKVVAAKTDGEQIMLDGSSDGKASNVVPISDTLPVYASIEGGRIMFVTAQVVKRVRKQDILTGVEGTYGVLVSGTSMSPVFEPGDTILLDHVLPIVVGADVLLRSCESRSDPAQDTLDWAAGGPSMMGRLVSYSPDAWTIKQFGDGETRTMQRSEWDVCHRIVARYPRV